MPLVPEVFANPATPGVASALTTLGAAITSTTATTFTASAAAPAALQIPNAQFRILIDSEIMLVTAGSSGTTWTVTRGVEGSTKATHSNGASVYHVLTSGALVSLIGGPPCASATVRAGGSDDTSALSSAVTNVVTAGIANGSYYGEVWIDTTNGPLQILGGFDTSQAGSAQIALPLITTTGPKFTLAIRALRSGAAGYHWLQTSQQPTAIWSNATSSTGLDAIIGGPAITWTDPNGSPAFTNYHLILDGLSIANTHNSGMTYVAAYRVAQCNAINGLGLLTERHPTQITGSGLVSNSNGIGIYFPISDNNDNNGVDNLVIYDIFNGFAFTDHFRAQRLETIYCPIGGFMEDADGGVLHGAYIDYWSCEGGGTILQASSSAGGNFPIHVGRIDCEAQTGTDDIVDTANRLFGNIGFAEDTARAPLVSGGANLEIINIHQARGHATLTLPTSAVATVMGWRNGMLNIHGGTVTAVAINGTTLTGVTGGVIPYSAGQTLTLTYTGTPVIDAFWA